MKYVFYLRVSTKKQDTRTQEETCLKHVRSLHNGTFQYKLYTDEITTRKPIAKREGFQQAMNALNQGDTLVAMRVDRLSRNSHEVSCIIHDLEKVNANILLVEQPGIKNKILLGLYAGMAEEEVKLIRCRIKEKLTVKASRGERISYQTPYGQQLDKKNLIPIKNKDKEGFTMKIGKLIENPKEKETLDFMCQLFDEGYSYRKIAQKLSEGGHLNRNGNPIHCTSVFRILSRTGRNRPRETSQQEEEVGLLHS